MALNSIPIYISWQNPPTFLYNFQLFLRDLVTLVLFLQIITKNWMVSYQTSINITQCIKMSSICLLSSPFPLFMTTFSIARCRHVISTWGPSTSTRRHRRTCPGGPAISLCWRGENWEANTIAITAINNSSDDNDDNSKRAILMILRIKVISRMKLTYDSSKDKLQ